MSTVRPGSGRVVLAFSLSLLVAVLVTGCGGSNSSPGSASAGSAGSGNGGVVGTWNGYCYSGGTEALRRYEFHEDGTVLLGSYVMKYKVLADNRLQFDAQNGSSVMSYSTSGDVLTLNALDGSNSCSLARQGSNPGKALTGKWNGNCMIITNSYTFVAFRNNGTMAFGYGSDEPTYWSFQVQGTDHLLMTVTDSSRSDTISFQFSVSGNQLKITPHYGQQCSFTRA